MARVAAAAEHASVYIAFACKADMESGSDYRYGSTPEFHPTIVLFSSPLSLLVLLWGMTTDRIWKRLKPDQQETSLRPL
jgi:hypothetical protein